MIKILRLACLASVLFAALPCVADDLSSTKQAAVAVIDANRTELVGLADEVWAFAETAFNETRSAAVLADYARKSGFHGRAGSGRDADRLRRELW